MVKLNTQDSFDFAIRGNKIVIGSVDVYGHLSVASNPVAQDNTIDARRECARLALANPGKTFVMMVLGGAERTVPAPRTLSI